MLFKFGFDFFKDILYVWVFFKVNSGVFLHNTVATLTRSGSDIWFRDGTGQHFCTPARQELTRNRLARPVYAKLPLIFWPGPARGP